jgi:FKBP-type peptidyl-prolyl cis-trans isomerase 2
MIFNKTWPRALALGFFLNSVAEMPCERRIHHDTVELKEEGFKMEKAKGGNTVKVHYTGKLDDGTVFDSSRERGPLEFTIGKGQLIKGFEDTVVGMSLGENRTVNIPQEEAYGPHKEELVIKVERSMIPESIELAKGLCLNVRQPDGGVMDVIVKEIFEDTVTLDANHPLAGKTLNFEIELVEIA